MGSLKQEWARCLHRDSYKTLMPTADTQDGGLRGRVELWTLTVECVGGGSQMNLHSLSGGEKLPENPLWRFQWGSQLCSLPVMCNFSSSYAGCPHCKKVIPHFTATADIFKDDRKIACAAVDCVKENNQDLCQQEAIKGYPTFHYYHYGKFVEKYDSDRTVSWERNLP